MTQSPAFLGMNPGSARELADLMRSAHTVFTQYSSQASTALGALPWTGADANHFRTSVCATALACLDEALAMMLDFANELDPQADEQDRASQGQTAAWHQRGVPGERGAPPALGAVQDTSEYSFVPALLSPLVYEPSELELVDVIRHDDVENTTLIDLLERNHETRLLGTEEATAIRVTEVMTATGDTMIVVQIPPSYGGALSADGSISESWSSEYGNPFGWGSNVDLMTTAHSDAKRAVEKALQDFGVKQGAPLTLVGHSQGGAVAHALSHDPDFNGEGAYNVVDVVSVGGPVDPFPAAQMNTRARSIEHHGDMTMDPITLLDGEGELHKIPHDFIQELKVAAGISDGEESQIENPIEKIEVSGFAFLGDDVSSLQDVLDDPLGAITAYGTYNHDNIRYLPDGSIDPDYGYGGSTLRESATNPQYIQLHEDLDGLSLGEDLRYLRDESYIIRRSGDD